MTDEELGKAIWKKIGSLYFEDTLGAAARELLAKPVATRESVIEFMRAKVWSVDDVLAALTHFAPPRQRMMIEHWTTDGIARHIERLTNLSMVSCRGIADWIMMLATTPAPEVDADAGAKALAWEFHKAALVEIGAENADDLWASFKDHQRLGWRAVAAREKGNG